MILLEKTAVSTTIKVIFSLRSSGVDSFGDSLEVPTMRGIREV